MDFAKFRTTSWIRLLIPITLLTLSPPAVFVFWYVATALNGSFVAFWELVKSDGFFTTIWDIWRPVCFGSSFAWKTIALFGAFELFLMKVLPGKPFLGPVTPKGNIPVYKANGVASFGITVGTFLFAAYGLRLFSPSMLYDHLGEILGALNCFSLGFCFFLYLKGILAPSSSDASTSGSFLFDYYWGTELYPKIFGWNVKQFTNCRFGMMSWPLLIISYADKQAHLYGYVSDAMFISVLLQVLYVAKFFIWETGYFRSLDIMHDRAGFMICWGCLVFVPAIYTSPALYLVHHPVHLGGQVAALIFAVGVLAIFANYFADKQRQKVRATEGKCLVWRKLPVLIAATYQTQNGETKQNLLLASGFWGISRHFHYVPELIAAFCWSLPALFSGFFPYFYVAFLACLLFDRAYRHDKRCHDKYGKHWEEYCEKVPYRIIPFVF